MLRRCLIGFCVFVLLLMVAANWARPGCVQRWGALFPLGLILLTLIFERFHYKEELDAPPGPEWVPTGEKQRDDKGGLSVWQHPATGARVYVRDQAG
jgi:hypothetical protein